MTSYLRRLEKKKPFVVLVPPLKNEKCRKKERNKLQTLTHNTQTHIEDDNINQVAPNQGF